MKRLTNLTKKVKTSFNSYFIVWIFILFLLLLVAYMYNENTIYLLVFLLFALGTVNELFARWNLFKVEVLFLPDERFFANTEGNLSVIMVNFGRGSSYGIEFENRKVKTLESKHKKRIKLKQKFLQRGFNKLPSLEIRSIFPLPYLNAKKKFKSYGGITVYPKPQGQSLEKKFGINTSLLNGDDEFEGIRPYIEGESLSRIHWASFAKREKWMSKEFKEESENIELSLEYDKIEAPHEQKLSQLCLWILECEKHNIPFCLTLYENIYHSKNEDIDTILEKLAYA